MSTNIRLIIDPPQSGPWNMAVDEVLLNDAIANGTATLRFYQWSEPTLSLGYFQSYADREQHAASRNCTVVRRQSGGGAILHDRELTYGLVLPPGHRLAHNAPMLYDAVHASFIDVLTTSLPAADHPRIRLRMRGNEPPVDASEPFLCFQRRSPGDVVFEHVGLTTAAESTKSATNSSIPWKILGSAQRRHRGAILQHGSLLIARSLAAPELPGWNDLSDAATRAEWLTPLVAEDLAKRLNFHQIPYRLTPELESMAGDLANDKYSAATWTNRR